VLRIDPTSAEAHFALGNVDIRQNRLDGAISHFREAVRLAGGAGGGNAPLSDAWSRDERVDPVVFKARLHLAGALMVQGRHREAITEYRSALSSEVLPSAPERFKSVRGMAQFQLGRLLYMTREYDEAIAAYRAALELVPDSDEVRRGLESAIAGKRRARGS
jgi:tetratricopeptide (TPR) repeat protein